MRHVDQRGAAAGKHERKAVGADEAVLPGLRARPLDEFRAARLRALVDPFEHHHLRAVERPVGGLAAGKSRLVSQHRVAGRIDEAGCRERHVAVARRELDLAHPVAVAPRRAQDRAGEHDDADFAHRLLDPARQRDLVVHDDGGVRRPAAAVMQRVLLAEVVQDAVRDAVGELVAVRAVGEQAAERADDRVDRLAAERRQPVDQRDLAAEARRFERRRDAGDAGAEHADVDGHVLRCRARGTPHDPRRRRNGSLLRAHRPMLQRHAAVDQMRLAGDVARLVGGEEHRERRDLVRGAEPAHRLAVDEGLAHLAQRLARSASTASEMRPSSEGVSMVPGQIAFARMPCLMKSAATALVSPITAALVAP